MKNIGLKILQFQKKNRAEKTNAENPFFKSDYVTLDQVWKDIREDLQTLGLAVIQNPISDNGGYGIESIIVDTATGETITARILMPLSKNDPQGVGSAITYARRYCLTAQLGLTVDSDDDGNAAVKHPTEPQKMVSTANLSVDSNGKLKQMDSMLSEMFTPEEIKAYLLKATTWIDKEKKTHKGIDNTKVLSSEKQISFLFDKIKKVYQEHLTAMDAGQEVRKEKSKDETCPF